MQYIVCCYACVLCIVLLCCTASGDEATLLLVTRSYDMPSFVPVLLMWQASADSAILACLDTNAIFVSWIGPASNAENVFELWLIPLQSCICC